MAIKDYVQVLRERWVLIVVVTLVAMIGAGVAWALRPPDYTARLSLYVSGQAADTADDAYRGSLLSQQRMSSYVTLVGSTRVSREVIRDLGLAETPQTLAGHISASTSPDSMLIEIAVVGRSPEQVTAVANSVGRVFTDLVAELERPAEPLAAPPVAVRVVEPAAVPTEPSSPGLPVPLLLGLLAGAAAGFGLALIRNAMDTSIKTAEQLEAATQAPNLGTIAYDSKIPKRPLIVHETPQAPRAEAFRQVRTNLEYIDVDNPHKVIVMTSAVPQEGKTTSICNLAITMAAAGRHVLVVEADLRRPELAGLLGLDGSVGLTDVLANRMRPQTVLQRWEGAGIDVLASGPLPPNPSELLASRQMAALLSGFRETYDMVLIDSPPLLAVTDAAAMAPRTDGAIVLCRYGKTTREQVRRTAAALAAVSAPLLGTVLTMAPRTGSSAYPRYDSDRHVARRPAAAAGPAAEHAADPPATADHSGVTDHARATDHTGTTDRTGTTDHATAERA